MGEQVDLPDGEVICRAPVRVQETELLIGQRPGGDRGGAFPLPLHASTIRDAAGSRQVATSLQSMNDARSRNDFLGYQPVHWRRDEEQARATTEALARAEARAKTIRPDSARRDHREGCGGGDDAGCADVDRARGKRAGAGGEDGGAGEGEVGGFRADRCV